MLTLQRVAQTLDLSWNGLGGSSVHASSPAVALARSLFTNNVLVHVNLSHNRFSEKECAILAEAVKVCVLVASFVCGPCLQYVCVTWIVCVCVWGVCLAGVSSTTASWVSTCMGTQHAWTWPGSSFPWHTTTTTTAMTIMSCRHRCRRDRAHLHTLLPPAASPIDLPPPSQELELRQQGRRQAHQGLLGLLLRVQ